MGKRIGCILVILFCIISVGCSSKIYHTSDNIKSPKLKNNPINGQWISYKSIDGTSLEVDEDFNTSEIDFLNEQIKLDGQLIDNISYKTRFLNLGDYLFYKHKLSPEDLGLEDGKVHIITIYTDGRFYMEIISYEDELIYYNKDKFVFYRENISLESQETKISFLDTREAMGRQIKLLEENNSGILIGLKEEFIDEDYLRNWNYRTVWLATKNSQIISSYELDNILLPRKKGFWIVESQREKDVGIRDNITTRWKESKELVIANSSLVEGADKSMDLNLSQNLSLKNIQYVGNDYISLEEIGNIPGNANLRLYPVDYLENNNPVTISNLFGKDKSRDIEKDLEENNKNYYWDERNFGLRRKNGYWILVGRYNYIKNKESYYRDFNIKEIPPREVVNYDDLSIPWIYIKDKFPKAIDGFISPNKDIIIIEEVNRINIFPLEDEEIILDKGHYIDKNENETIIMAEWSRGNYTQIWEDEVKENQPRILILNKISQ